MNKKWLEGATNVAILFKCDHSNTLPVRSEALLGCRETTVRHNFSAPRGTLMNLELLREVTQVSPYSDSTLGPHTR